jgi:hypothetical protein
LSRFRKFSRRLRAAAAIAISGPSLATLPAGAGARPRGGVGFVVVPA